MSNPTKHLERAAIRHHARGQLWDQFWTEHGDQVRQAEPYNAKRYHRLVRRLVGLVAAGDLNGSEPVGTGWPRPEPWELDALEAQTC
jgi:hypothetical protein